MLALTKGSPEERDPPPDVVLLDLTLPDMSGGDMIRNLRAMGCPLPEMIVTSAMPGRVVDSEARAIGAFGVMHKPYDIAALVKLLNSAVDASRRYRH